jgi:DNA-binding MarR family transcriptional regulator
MSLTHPTDAELIMVGRDVGDALSLRVWLRMTSCVSMIDDEIRRRLREQFGTTRPRFDFMAHLAGVPEGLTLGELSQRMLVSNGNMTGIAKRLMDDGLIERLPHAADKRITRVSLTEKGIKQHRAMADAYEHCVEEMLNALDEPDKEVMLTVLSMLRNSVATRTAQSETP